MKIGIITTIDTNIGDDFIREGIMTLLNIAFPDRDISYFLLNKHVPLTVYPKWHPLHFVKYTRQLPIGSYRLTKFIETYAHTVGYSYFHKCDAIIQSGAPVLWHGCHNCEWAKPIWYDIIGKIYKSKPVLNLAAGSCYPLEGLQALALQEKDKKYLVDIHRFCKVTTVRETLAKDLFNSLGLHTELLPCTAFLIGCGRNLKQKKRDTVLINYMEGGGHYDWNQSINKEQWEQTVRSLIDSLVKTEKVAFICHSQEELNLAKKLRPDIHAYLPLSMDEYLDVISEAKYALCNRMHASVLMASFGIPSVAVCTDTRLFMVKQLGLPISYVKDAKFDWLKTNMEALRDNIDNEKDRLLKLRSKTLGQYVELIKQVL